jgi:TPR repeat protein
LGKFYLFGSVIMNDDKTGDISEYNYYQNGEVVKKDVVKGAEWLLKSAHQGYAPAQVKLGECYRCGEGVAKDQARVIEWFRKAADQKYSDGQIELGCCYMDGDGVPQDYDKAAELFSKATKQGHGFARDYLAERKNWKEIQKNLERALTMSNEQ